ncbi:hypothetical protein A4G16_05720 [Mannheimia granulomatis]|uniref:PepSY domain-containing protein n=1 Tax=Mannheimia granulomatis TaxID=85402 RepID=A0A6G8JIA0_9PAST|nr:hypothetical protein [Mannheimia granulomatis]QIM66905.1 hypothetical protein A4G16_05720 [Mannheimia granulomatis]
MKAITKTLVILTPFLSATAFAGNTIPAEIYQPQGDVVKSERQADGEFEVEYKVQGKDVRGLAEKATDHAKSQGFTVLESKINNDDADLKFKRGTQELDVDIEIKGNHIEYKAELDAKK